MFDIVNGRQNRVLKHDFTEAQSHYDGIMNIVIDRYKEIAEKQDEKLLTEEDQKKRSYMYYRPNREFTGVRESLKLKKVDDGTFVDNGYRWSY